jgi:uncharacterized protein YdhG (YjbR/CyaY superfamily)
MKSTAENVDDYVAQVDEQWRPIVERLRSTCLEHLDGCHEVMAYGMPTYMSEGQVEVGFARQVKYLSFYIAKKGVLDAHRDDFRDLSLGKGCIRFTRPDQVDWSLIDVLLRETALCVEPPC